MSERERIVAPTLLTHENVRAIGDTLARIYAIDETPCFGELLQALDEADREVWREYDASDPERR